MKLILATDSEFIPMIDNPTQPLSLTIEDGQGNIRFYIHPNASEDVLKHAKKIGDKIFKHDFAILDFLEDVYQFKVEKVEDGKKLKNYKSIEILLFFSFKDIEFLFKNREDYINLVLSKLSRTRRISVQNIVETNDGAFCSESIGIPYTITMPDERNKGKNRKFKLSIQIADISAMQGGDSLKNYASNVGILMSSKDNYTPEQKKRMDLQYVTDSSRFKDYAMGDTPLIEIRQKTFDFYNHIAELIGIETRPKGWGMSTGKIVATMLNDWLCKQLKISSEELYHINSLAGSEGITAISKVIKNKSLVYGGMVDGGRTVKERFIDYLIGDLIDIDISGCYGNGLKNQLYAVGFPSIESEEILLKDWLKKYDKELIPGLWYARISWENAPFKQDLLISKTEQAFSSWNWVIHGYDNDGFAIDDDDKKVYDASMCLTTKSIHYASLNHDLLQTLKKVASKQEWGWLRDNAVINCSFIYKKSLEVETPTQLMLEGASLSDKTEIMVKSSKNWLRVDLNNLVSILLKERKLHAKGTPLNVFLKLIINTMYGCIASEFFSIKNACVSNVIVGNNITARARCLAWCMAKGFHSAMSITDGGVFDINNVLFYRKKSLNLLEGLHRNILTGINRLKFVDKKHLLGCIVDFNSPNFFNDMVSKFGDESVLKSKIVYEIEHKEVYDKRTDLQIIEDVKKRYVLDIIDKKSWEHLANIFDIDIFNLKQFSFESKDIYTKLIIHSKVDYYLEKSTGQYTIAFRGMTKVWDEIKQKKIVNPEAIKLFEAIENDTPYKTELETSELLSLSEYKNAIKRDSNYPLLPHDSISKKKVFYSHTPRGCRVENLNDLKRLDKRYKQAKKTKDELIVKDSKEWGSRLSDS